jgi:hypothetical protein
MFFTKSALFIHSPQIIDAGFRVSKTVDQGLNHPAKPFPHEFMTLVLPCFVKDIEAHDLAEGLVSSILKRLYLFFRMLKTRAFFEFCKSADIVNTQAFFLTQHSLIARVLDYDADLPSTK